MKFSDIAFPGDLVLGLNSLVVLVIFGYELFAHKILEQNFQILGKNFQSDGFGLKLFRSDMLPVACYSQLNAIQAGRS